MDEGVESPYMSVSLVVRDRYLYLYTYEGDPVNHAVAALCTRDPTFKTPIRDSRRSVSAGSS
jgi:hypothetical protein